MSLSTLTKLQSNEVTGTAVSIPPTDEENALILKCEALKAKMNSSSDSNAISNEVSDILYSLSLLELSQIEPSPYKEEIENRVQDIVCKLKQLTKAKASKPVPPPLPSTPPPALPVAIAVTPPEKAVVHQTVLASQTTDLIKITQPDRENLAKILDGFIIIAKPLNCDKNDLDQLNQILSKLNSPQALSKGDAEILNTLVQKIFNESEREDNRDKFGPEDTSAFTLFKTVICNQAIIYINSVTPPPLPEKAVIFRTVLAPQTAEIINSNSNVQKEIAIALSEFLSIATSLSYTKNDLLELYQILSKLNTSQALTEADAAILGSHVQIIFDEMNREGDIDKLKQDDKECLLKLAPSICEFSKNYIDEMRKGKRLTPAQHLRNKPASSQGRDTHSEARIKLLMNLQRKYQIT